jgi:ATP-dependent protease ClpP protease subunit
MPMPKKIKIDGVVGTGEGEISSSWVKSQLPTNGLDPIELVIHSEGGSVFEGFAIYDALCQYQGPKKCVISSYAASIASFIPMACNEVEITPNGYMMMHAPYSEEGGTAADMMNGATLLADMESKMVAAYSAKSGKPANEITAILSKDTFFNAEQCLANGFVNKIAPSPVVGRMVAKAKSMPHGIYQALFGAGPGGDNREPTKEKSMSESQKPVAATVKQIKAAFPKAKNEFIVKAMEQEMPMEQVASSFANEAMTENETLSAKVMAMETELAALKAKALEIEVEPKEEEVMPPAAKAKSGVTPVAKAKTAGSVSAKAKWQSLIQAKVSTGVPQSKAVAFVNKENPGLREQMLAEVNG